MRRTVGVNERSRGVERRNVETHKGTVGKVVKIIRNDDQGSDFAPFCSAQSIFQYKIAFIVYCQGVISEKLVGFGALYFDLQAG